jgi:prefoldin subunit 5
MAMLDRYKKTGGFNQLLTLLETCGTQKQTKFLEIIRAEDPRWADALVAKMIDLKRFLTWSDAAIAEVTGAMLDLNVGAVISSLPEDQQTRLLGTLPHIKRRKVQDQLDGSKPSPGEVATSINKLFETIRKLSQDGILRLDKVDPVLFIDADIEDRLKNGMNIGGVPSAAESFAKANAAALLEKEDDAQDGPKLQIVKSMNTVVVPSKADGQARANEQEIQLLKKRIQILQQENAALKQELTSAQAKLDQIRKLS